SNVEPLLRADPHIDEILSFSRTSGWLHHMQQNDIIEPLRQGNYDLGILLTNSFSSAWWFWRGDVKKRVGFKGNWRNLLLTDAVLPPSNIETQHLVNTY